LGGQETLIPNLECVAPNLAGTLTACFGYNNKNGVGVTVPFGANNQLALDASGFRNKLFTPGLHPFAFGVDFTSNQTVSYSLAPDNSPRTDDQRHPELPPVWRRAGRPGRDGRRVPRGRARGARA
jgi:hypothetical protein